MDLHQWNSSSREPEVGHPSLWHLSWASNKINFLLFFCKPVHFHIKKYQKHITAGFLQRKASSWSISPHRRQTVLLIVPSIHRPAEHSIGSLPERRGVWHDSGPSQYQLREDLGGGSLRQRAAGRPQTQRIHLGEPLFTFITWMQYEQNWPLWWYAGEI